MVGMALDLHFQHKPQVIQDAAGDIFDLYAKGKIKPQVTVTYLLEEVSTALSQFGQTKSIGKMVMTTAGDGFAVVVFGACTLR